MLRFQDSDLIIFPEEAEFMKVKQTPQRVYMLVFKGSNKKFFFWMQEVCVHIIAIDRVSVSQLSSPHVAVLMVLMMFWA